MRFRIRNLVTFAGIAVGITLLSCGPDIKYPKCETDEHCKQDGEGTALSEYCVNGRCQECREETHCRSGYACASGRCEKKSECPCEEPLICEKDKCVEPPQPECVTNEDCEGNMICEGEKCIEAPCKMDQECGAGMVCNEGVCEAAPTQRISASCQPMERSRGEVIALETVTFDFNKADLRVDTREALDRNAKCLQEAPDVALVVEGHCDDRGTQEYNLALGERRAAAVQSYLGNLGIDASRMRVLSKGKNEPVCRQQTESCWAKNRRVQFLQTR